MWPSTNQTPQNRSHDRALNRLMHTFQRPTAVSGKWVALNYLNTSFVCITGLVSALRQCSNGLERIVHSPSARALSHPWPLLHRPRALIQSLMHAQLVFKYYFIIPNAHRPSVKTLVSRLGSPHKQQCVWDWDGECQYFTWTNIPPVKLQHETVGY